MISSEKNRSAPTSLDASWSATHEFGFPNLHKPNADAVIAPLDGRLHSLQRHAIGQKLIAIYDHPVLFYKAANGGHFRDSWRPGEFIAEKPVLDGTQLSQVVPVAYEDALVDPSHTGGARPEEGRDAFRQPARTGNNIPQIMTKKSIPRRLMSPPSLPDTFG